MKKYLTLLFLCIVSLNLYGLEAAPSSESSPLTQEESKQEMQKEPSHFDESYAPYLEKPDTESFQNKFFRMLFLLTLIIGFMILASFMLKKMTKTRLTNLNVISNIKVLEARTLSPKSILYLIEVKGQNILIAESAAGINLLTSLGKSEEEDV